jgi:hypothetical protein
MPMRLRLVRLRRPLLRNLGRLPALLSTGLSMLAALPMAALLPAPLIMPLVPTPLLMPLPMLRLAMTRRLPLLPLQRRPRRKCRIRTPRLRWLHGPRPLRRTLHRRTLRCRLLSLPSLLTALIRR